MTEFRGRYSFQARQVNAEGWAVERIGEDGSRQVVTGTLHSKVLADAEAKALNEQQQHG